MRRNNLIFVLLSFLCVSILLNLYQASYSNDLTEQIATRDTLIRTEREDHILHDTIQIHHSTSYSVDGKEITFDDLFDMLLKLQDEKNRYRDSCNYYKNFYAMSQKIHNDEFKEERQGDTIKYIYKTAPQVDKAKIESKINSLSINKSIYDRICQRYDISVSNVKENNGTITFEIHAEKLDSALMLLPYYRHKLKYDSKKHAWRIK